MFLWSKPKFSFAVITLSLVFAAFSAPISSAQDVLTSCTNLTTHAQIALKSPQRSCASYLAPAIWHAEKVDTAVHVGPNFATLRVCTSPNFSSSYQQIRPSCERYQKTTDYYRLISAPKVPIISSASASSYDGVILSFNPETVVADSPIAYYLVKNLTTGITTKISKVSMGNHTQIHISNLSPKTAYTFTIASVNIDGASGPSSISAEVTTYPLPVGAPAFTLSASSESRSANSAATGFTVNSTGGAIASFAISPAAPVGMSFNTSTGAFSGTPTTVASATIYTITATNSTGSASATFSFTVTAAIYSIGMTGPGGGTIFYVDLATGFNCGSGFTSTGSPSGGLCHYLEAAPSGWHNGGVPATDPTLIWAVVAQQANDVAAITNEAVKNNSSATLGLGYLNSVAIVNQGNDATTAAGAARAYSGGSLNDWYLPTTSELNQLCRWAVDPNFPPHPAVCAGGTIGKPGFDTNGYWSSSEETATYGWYQFMSNGYAYTGFKPSARFVRPIRAF